MKHTLTIKESIQLKHDKYIHVFNFYVFIMLGYLFINRLRVSELQCKVLFET